MIEKTDYEPEVIAELEAGGLSNRRRRTLLSKLRQIGTERSIGVLSANLRSVDTKSQVRAVFALAHIGTEEAVDALIDSLTVTTGPCFTFAVKSLGDNHAARAMPALTRTLEERRGEFDEGDKRLIIKALYQSPHRSQVPALTALLRERSRDTRRMAAEVLAQIKATEAREALEEAATSLSWLRGRQARRALRSLRHVSGD
jgi:HEAT repeat protein